MNYPKQLFNLQIQFAQKVSEVEEISLEEALLFYTAFYKYLKIKDWDFDANNPVWQDYLHLVRNAENLLDVTYKFYLESMANSQQSEPSDFGCFSYNFEEEDNAVQIHFSNRETPEPGALSKEMVEVRKKELRAMFSEIKEKYPDLKEVWGFSWLYNIEAYQRLFPREYIETRVEIKNWFKSQALWGQFLNKYGNLKNELANNFLNCVKNKNSKDELRLCFPFQVYELIVSPEVFYEFFGI